MFHAQQREKHFFLERRVYDLNPTVFSLPLFSLTYLSMPLLALVSSYRICIWEKCFQTSSAHKANDRSSSASNAIELWCHLQNNPSSILGLRLELELSVHSCCQQPACSAAVIGLLSSPESRWESTAHIHDWPLQMHVFTWGQDRGTCPPWLIHYGKCQRREMACQAKEAFWLISPCGGCTKPLGLAENILTDQLCEHVYVLCLSHCAQDSIRHLFTLNCPLIVSCVSALSLYFRWQLLRRRDYLS